MRLIYLITKEFRQIRRERIFVGIIFIMPLIQIVLLGFAITTDITNVPLITVDEDHSTFSRRITEAFAKGTTFRYVENLNSKEAARQAIDLGVGKLAVIIPQHFERDLKMGNQPEVLILIDGVDGNSAGIIASYVNQLSEQLQQEWLFRSNAAMNALQKPHLVTIIPRMVYNPDLRSVNNIVPGILAILIFIITSFLTSMSIVREKEIGTLEQLMVTPIKSWELLAGKIIPMLVVAFLLFNVGLLFSYLIFGLWIKGSLLSLYLLVLLFSLSGLSLGIFISTISNTQQQAMFFSWFFMIFSILLSGFFIPIENMPQGIRLLTYLNPTRYFMVIIRGIYLKGTHLADLWPQTLAMTIFGGVMFLLAGLRFHKRLN